jgi:hypothetical protein
MSVIRSAAGEVSAADDRPAPVVGARGEADGCDEQPATPIATATGIDQRAGAERRQGAPITPELTPKPAPRLRIVDQAHGYVAGTSRNRFASRRRAGHAVRMTWHEPEQDLWERQRSPLTVKWLRLALDGAPEDAPVLIGFYDGSEVLLREPVDVSAEQNGEGAIRVVITAADI